jgi:Phage integrase SAM-like domain/Phage integrase family
LSVFKCGRYFYYDFEFGGRRYHKSTRMTNQRAAEQVESVLKGELVQGRNGLRPYKQPPPFGEYVQTFLKRIEKPLAQNTVDLHNNSLKTLLKLFKNRFLDQITRSMIEDFKAGRAKEFKKGSKTQLVSAATVNRELGTLKKILNMAVDDELITINPARKVHAFPEAIPDVHILSFEEELNYLALASEPLKSVAIIMLGQGMRSDEVFRMMYSNLDFFNRTILIVRGKTKNAKRTLSMSQEVSNFSRRAGRAIQTTTGSFLAPENQVPISGPSEKPMTTFARKWDCEAPSISTICATPSLPGASCPGSM